MNYPGAPPTQFSPGSSDPYPTRADPTDRRYTQAATQQPPDPSYQYPPGAGPTGTSYYTQADITAPTFPWAPFASGNMNYPYPAVAGPTHADPTHASYTHPHTAAPTVHTGSSSGARAGTTPPTYHSWMVMFPQGMYPMKSSRSREEGRQAIERLNCLHDSLQSLMKFANRSEYMTLADYSDFQDFNSES